jgi:hypothetical protein
MNPNLYKDSLCSLGTQLPGFREGYLQVVGLLNEHEHGEEGNTLKETLAMGNELSAKDQARLDDQWHLYDCVVWMEEHVDGLVRRADRNRRGADKAKRREKAMRAAAIAQAYEAERTLVVRHCKEHQLKSKGAEHQLKLKRSECERLEQEMKERRRQQEVGGWVGPMKDGYHMPATSVAKRLNRAYKNKYDDLREGKDTGSDPSIDSLKTAKHQQMSFAVFPLFVLRRTPPPDYAEARRLIERGIRLGGFSSEQSRVYLSTATDILKGAIEEEPEHSHRAAALYDLGCLHAHHAAYVNDAVGDLFASESSSRALYESALESFRGAMCSMSWCFDETNMLNAEKSIKAGNAIIQGRPLSAVLTPVPRPMYAQPNSSSKDWRTEFEQTSYTSERPLWPHRHDITKCPRSALGVITKCPRSAMKHLATVDC